jgi:hypothetical protein
MKKKHIFADALQPLKNFNNALRNIHIFQTAEKFNNMPWVKTAEKLSNILYRDVEEEELPLITHSKEQTCTNAWAAILNKLAGKELIAAKLAIEKCRGKNHYEAFNAARPGDYIADPTNYVSKKRKLAEDLSKRHNLPMPKWDTSK